MGRRSSTAVTGVARDDSDDELGIDDHPWEWIYRQPQTSGSATKRKGNDQHDILGARMGTFECYVGDCVLLKAEGSNEAWVAIVAGFREADDDGDKAADFLWFSTEKEIRNSDRKRKDFLPVSLVCTLVRILCLAD